MSGGLFITFEGGEGSGKTTQISLLKDRLESLGRVVRVTREPGGTTLGNEIRRQLVQASDDPPCPRAELLLYAADRAHHVEKFLRPALKRGEVVLCDRYTDATEAYQGWGRALGLQLIHELNRVATDGLRPHRTIFLDIDPAEGVRRSLARQAQSGFPPESRFEEEDGGFHRRVREGYQAICRNDPDRVRRVSGEGTVEEVSAGVWAALSDLFIAAAD